MGEDPEEIFERDGDDTFDDDLDSLGLDEEY